MAGKMPRQPLLLHPLAKPKPGVRGDDPPGGVRGSAPILFAPPPYDPAPAGGETGGGGLGLAGGGAL